MDVDNMKKQTQKAFGNYEAILTCSCFRMDKKASEAFCLMFPDKVCPEIIKGRDRVYKLAQSLHNEHIKAISKLSGKYAYYVQIENNKIVKEIDLLTGRRIS